MGLAAGFMIMVLTALGAGDGLKASIEGLAAKGVESVAASGFEIDAAKGSAEAIEMVDVKRASGSEYVVPVSGVIPASLADTWGAPRSEGRQHEGIDIFAERNTPVVAAISGRIFRIGISDKGGNVVWVLGDDGRRHYYAHLESFSDHEVGQPVRTGETIGYLGNSGNAITTPPHLHYGVYTGEGAMNPYPLLTGSDS